MAKFDDLSKAYAKGTLCEADLVDCGVSPGDFIKLRNDERAYSENIQYQPEPAGDRTFRYVFVTESAIGVFKDLPLADSWSMKDFNARRAPVLYHHDSFAAPIGRAFGVKKNQEFKNVLALMGKVQFAEEGLSPQADFAHGLVEVGLLNGGSVGFRVEEMREPTPEEIKKFKLSKFSAVFTKSNLTEFSVLGVGRDPLAGVVYSADGQTEFEKFITENPDRFDADVVMAFREYNYTGAWKAPERIMVQVDKPIETLRSALEEFGLSGDAAEEVSRVAGSRLEENQVRVVTNSEWSDLTGRITQLEAPKKEEEVTQEDELPEDLLEWTEEQLEQHLETAQGGDE